MRYRATARVLSVLLAAVAIGAAGCGSSNKKTTSTSTPSPSAATKESVTKTTYRAGEFCSVKKSAVYKAQGFKCAKVKGTYRLEKG